MASYQPANFELPAKAPKCWFWHQQMDISFRSCGGCYHDKFKFSLVYKGIQPGMAAQPTMIPSQYAFDKLSNLRLKKSASIVSLVYSWHLQNDMCRLPTACLHLAVPYRAAGWPSERSECAQPDVALIYTTISYYQYGMGLTLSAITKAYYKQPNQLSSKHSQPLAAIKTAFSPLVSKYHVPKRWSVPPPSWQDSYNIRLYSPLRSWVLLLAAEKSAEYNLPKTSEQSSW